MDQTVITAAVIGWLSVEIIKFLSNKRVRGLTEEESFMLHDLHNKHKKMESITEKSLENIKTIRERILTSEETQKELLLLIRETTYAQQLIVRNLERILDTLTSR